MPKFAFRLEATDGSGHYRQGAIFATNEESARAFLERQEQAKADYQLTETVLDDPDDVTSGRVEPSRRFTEILDVSLPDLSARKRAELAATLLDEGLDTDGFRKLPGAVRGAVAVHHQAEPYKLVRLEKAKG